MLFVGLGAFKIDYLFYAYGDVVYIILTPLLYTIFFPLESFFYLILLSWSYYIDFVLFLGVLTNDSATETPSISFYYPYTLLLYPIERSLGV